MSPFCRSIALAAAIAAAGLASLTCGTSTPPTTPPPDPNVPKVTETFTGMIDMGEYGCHDFSVTAVGDVTLVITSLQPLSTLTVGMGIGQPDPSIPPGCALFVQDNSVRENETLLAGNLQIQDYCACIFDVGNIFPNATVTYTLDVTHP